MKRVLFIAVAALFLLAAPARAQEGSESLEKEARKAVNAGQFRKAALKFESAASAASDPQRRSRMLVQAGWAHFNDGKRPDAQDAIRRAFTGSPDLEIVADFFSPEFVKLAADVRREAVVAMPLPAADIGELKRVAKEKLADGNTEDVIHDLLYNVPREKLDAEAIDLLAQAYEKQGKFTEAAKVRASGPDAPRPPPPTPTGPRPPIGVVAAGPSQTPANTTDYLALGRAALARGDALNAQSAANRLLEIDPQSSDAYRLLGNAYALRGEMAFAKATLEQSLKKNERNEGALLDLYDLSMGEKNWDGALDALRRATEVNPENGAKLVALGRKARADGDLVHARQVFATAAVASPKDVSVLTEYASILLQAKDVDAALEPLMKAASVEPDREIVRANLASTLRRKGLWKDAEKEYREAVRADPDYAPALRGLGTLLLERGQAAQAIEPLKKAVLRDPTNVEGAWALARAQRQTGALKDAAGSLAASAGLDKAPLDDEAGAVAYERGRYEEAVGFFDRALAKEPGSAVYKANRDKAAAAAAFLKVSGLTVPQER
ncbi:MAG: tetratricopeptide repeat protein [Thermoanaerobaculia bacterium]|nr:tetratricopeptide repeat protein [Thermoanaerobaculia bacterium]